MEVALRQGLGWSRGRQVRHSGLLHLGPWILALDSFRKGLGSAPAEQNCFTVQFHCSVSLFS